MRISPFHRQVQEQSKHVYELLLVSGKAELETFGGESLYFII